MLERRAALVVRFVRGVQALERAGDDRRDDALGDRLPAAWRVRLMSWLERLAADVLHDEEELAVRRDDVERGHDVRVLDARREPRLVEEHRDELGDRRRTAGAAA